MSIIAWIIIGLLAGLIAKAIVPGRQPGGIIVTTLIGIAGGIIGGWIGGAITGQGLSGFSFWSLILAIAGIAGLVFLRRGDGTVGRTLVAYLCVAAVGAGIVLAFSTGAYVGAFLQAAPAALALVVIFGARRPAGPAGAQERPTAASRSTPRPSSSG